MKQYIPHRTPEPSKSTGKSTVSPIKRANHLKLVILLFGAILIGRMFYLQIVRNAHYEALAVSGHQKKFILPANRGTLYFRDDDNTVPAVLNDKVYTLYADPREVDDVEKTAEIISRHISVPREELRESLRRENTAYSVIGKRIEKSSIEALFKEKEDLRGVGFTPVPRRVYPEGALAGQVLGFVDDEGQGQYGLEGALNDRLKGEDGLLRAVTDVHGIPLSLDDTTNVAKPAKDGENVLLTIDRNIQTKAEEALVTGLKKTNATKGSILVLDPRSGAVKAMVNTPNYDPAKFYEVGSDAYERFSNRVVSDPYEAASVIKLLTVATGIDNGVVTKNSTYQNTGSVTVGDATIRNTLQTVNGTRTIADVLKYSLNTGTIHVLSALGGGTINEQARTTLYDYFTQRFGFGEVTGIEQNGEAPGIIYSPKSVEGNNVRYSNMTFGQGMSATMVQIAAATSSIINGGNYYQPHLVEGSVSKDGTVTSTMPEPLRKNVVSEDTSNQMREMMERSIRETDFMNAMITPGFNVGGKSGTAETIDAATGKYTKDSTIGSYIGYGADADGLPKYVIIVRVDDAKSDGYTGSVAAAPVFADVNNWLLTYYNVKPR